jgi:L-alanine-DL-glutamate epimerase-like enolase superfamily enzyme
MNIKALKTHCYLLPLREKAWDAHHGEQNVLELVTVDVIDEDDSEGYGYCYTIGYGGKAIETMIDCDLKRIILNNDRDIPELWEEMWHKVHWVGRGGVASLAIAAIDIALWDLKSRKANLPLYKYLHGTSKEIPVYGTSIKLGAPSKELIEVADRYMERGYKGIKIKIGSPDLETDKKVIKAIKRHIPDSFRLMVDANMSYQLKEAIDMGKFLKDEGAFWFEEPLEPELVSEHKQLKKEVGMTIALGENLHSVYEFNAYLAENIPDIVQIDAISVGGITPWLKVKTLAENSNKLISSHFSEKIHSHLLCTSSHSTNIEHHQFSIDEWMEEPITINNGFLMPSETPGHGVKFLKEKLRFYIK